MENISNREILEKVDELIDLIKKSPMYLQYQKLKDALERNNEINLLINEIKLLQQQIVKLEYNNMPVEKEKALLEEKINLLDAYPLYHEFITRQEELDDCLQQIKFIVERVINKRLN